MKSTSNYTTSQRKIKILAILLALVLAVIAFTGNYGTIRARAEESTTNAWALCKPGTYINIRLWPSKHATEVGFLDPCDRVEIDGRTKDGFAHVTYPVDGWVFAGYLTFSEPQEIGATYSVVARRRVAARRWIDGPQMGQKPWLVNGSDVQVFYIAGDWACTSRGYIQSEWLEVDPQ